MYIDIHKKLVELKHNSVFLKYLLYASISLFLGILLKFRILDEIFISVNSFTNASINILGLNEYILILNKNDYSPLFSTSAAILSTIFTLIFVLSTLYIQMSNKYTSLNIFSIKETKILMGTYFGTIILSLIMLETNYCCPTFILIMTIFCVLSIYPFMQSINSKLMYESGIKKLLSEIKISIDENKESRAISMINEVEDINKNIIKSRKSEYFYNAMPYFDDICRVAKEHQMEKVVSRIGYHYFDIMLILIDSNLRLEYKNRMVRFVLSSIETYTESYSDIINYTDLNGQVIFLNIHGTDLIKNGFKDVDVKSVVESLYNSFNSIQKKRSVDGSEVREEEIQKLERSIIEYMGELAKESFDKKLKLTINTSVMFLWKIGTEVLWATDKKKRPSSSILFAVVNQLNEIEDATGDVLFKSMFEYSKSQISDNQEIKPFLDKFEKYYSNAKYMIPKVIESFED